MVHRHQHRPAAAGGTIGPDMALAGSLGPNDVLALGGCTGNSDQDGSGGGMVPKYQHGHRLCPDSELLCNLWWQHELWTLAQTPAMLGPWTQIWSSAEAGSECQYCPRWQCRLSRLVWPQWQCDPQTLTWPQISGIHMAVNGDRNLRHQHGP